MPETLKIIVTDAVIEFGQKVAVEDQVEMPQEMCLFFNSELPGRLAATQKYLQIFNKLCLHKSFSH